ncbi:hypothetical protein SAMN05421680_13031 [Xenorhabdus mauleonii]|uniref:Uncharacterized protein n=1 Tax=Xenorhabdus mauleonii TaxID=351675 RepID=A0A1I3WZE5_9GAMM|nr:hypothetical protein SAMN05421680_13031 [Xenorhabdus mauleonii]
MELSNNITKLFCLENINLLSCFLTKIDKKQIITGVKAAKYRGDMAYIDIFSINLLIHTQN